MKKLTSLLLVLFAALLLVGCSCNDKEKEPKEKFEGGYASLVDPDGYKYEYNAEVGEGYISLASKFPNPPAQGKAGKDGLGKTYTVAGQEVNIKNYYKGAYSADTDQEHFDYLVNSWTYNSEKYTNMVDGLIENDKHGALVGALAKGYKIEDADGGAKEVYTFQLHEGVQWVKNATGEIYAEVTAEDFVSGLKYVLNPKVASATVQIVTGLIDGAAEYYEAHTVKNSVDSYNANQDAWVASWIEANSSEEAAATAEEAHAAAAAEAAKLATIEANLDFNKVGVKAVSKYEIAYKLVEKVPYFLSNLTYSPFLPVHQPFLDEVGTDFGISENNILVNGAYRMTRYDRESKIEYTKNTKYYDVDHVYIDHIELQYYSADIATPSKLREWFESGAVDSFTVNEQDLVGYEKYVTGPNGTGSLEEPANPLCNAVPSVGSATFIGYFNFNRKNYEYPADIAPKTDAEKAATQMAVRNTNFRLGIQYGQNSLEYLEYYNPNFPSQWLMRGYTVRELGTDESGKDYADYVDEVWRQRQGITSEVSLTGFLNGKGSVDPTYDPDKAAEYFAAAKAELIAAGLTEADFPIKLDVIGTRNATVRPYQTATYNSITENSGGVVQVQILVPADANQDTQWGSILSNYDYSLWSGWGPDYADPKTFLHTMIVGGDMVEMLGFDAESLKDPAIAQLQEDILGPYTALYELGNAITDVSQMSQRFQKFAEAEYALIYEYAIIVPWLSQNGYRPAVARTIPYQAGRASYGLTSDKFKNVVVGADTMTRELRATIVAAYEAEVE
ncbi:MAG TPA: hypothetical protein GXZ51_00905 [Acholeplasma sp.]|nr:hypothetical protein [Acholeplasma sp.]